MNRHEAIVYAIDYDTLTDAQALVLLQVLGQIGCELDPVTGVIYADCTGTFALLDLIKTQSIVPAEGSNCIMIYTLVDPANENLGVYLLDNTAKYIRVSFEDVVSGDVAIADIVPTLPEATTLVTEDFIDDLDTKTNLIAWMEARKLDDDIDTGILKAALFEAVKAHYNIVKTGLGDS